MNLTLDSVTRALGQVAFVHPAPEFHNELVSYDDGVHHMCARQASAHIQLPTSVNWETRTQADCDGRSKMIQVRGADHCVGGESSSDSYKCTVPLTKMGTTDHLSRFVQFFKEN